MGYNVNSLPAYIASNREELIRRSVLGAKSIDRFTVQADCKGVTALNLLEVSADLQDGSGCGFDAAGETKISQRNLDVKIAKVNSQWCPKDLLAKYTQWAVNISAKNPNLPFEEYITEEIIKDVDRQVEETAWMGNDTIGVSGITEILAADSEVTKVTYAEGTSDYDIVKKAYLALHPSVLNRAVIFVGQDTFRGFINDMVEKNYYHYSAGEGVLEEFMFPGSNVKVVASEGLNGTGMAVAGDPKGIFMGTDLLNDKEDFDLFYSKDDRVWKLVIEFALAFQVAFPDEYVLVKKA